jgi:hypothetical protein
MLGDRMQPATSFADPAIGASFTPLDVSELECVHESRAAQ